MSAQSSMISQSQPMSVSSTKREQLPPAAKNDLSDAKAKWESQQSSPSPSTSRTLPSLSPISPQSDKSQHTSVQLQTTISQPVLDHPIDVYEQLINALSSPKDKQPAHLNLFRQHLANAKPNMVQEMLSRRDHQLLKNAYFNEVNKVIFNTIICAYITSQCKLPDQSVFENMQKDSVLTLMLLDIYKEQANEARSKVQSPSTPTQYSWKPLTSSTASMKILQRKQKMT